MKFKNPDLTIIISSFNSRKNIENCITSIFKYPLPITIEVILSDDGSTDGTLNLVREKFKQVSIVEGQNRGFGAAINRGIKSSRGRYIMFLNDDTIVLKDSVYEMFNFMAKNQDVGLMGPKLLNANGSLQPSIIKKQSALKDIISLVLPRRILNDTVKTKKIFSFVRRFFPNFGIGKYENHEITQDVDCIYGACMILNRTLLKDVGMFDERIVHYKKGINICKPGGF